jgi:hypothetical protein
MEPLIKEVEEVAEHFWDQPAQFLLPWIKHKGKNFKDWMLYYKDLTNKLSSN